MRLSCSQESHLISTSPRCLAHSQRRDRTRSQVSLMPELPIVFTDFAAPGPAGVLYSLRRFGSPAGLSVGGRVRLEDSEGNSCEAQVVELGEELITLEPDWTTWAPSAGAANEPRRLTSDSIPGKGRRSA